MGSRTAFALLGPTASGKSRLALELGARFPLEIVSVDSAQVYRGMDIGTAKPASAERRALRHHLLDVIEPTERYSAGRFREDALGAIADILRRGRIPLLVGGTMLYYRALAAGLDALPQADAALRARLNAEAERLGWPALHAKLAQADPRSAARISPNDVQRIQRALEVWMLSGTPLSALQGGCAAPLPFELRAFGIVPPERSALHHAIAERFAAMLAAGLVEELAALRRRHALSADLPSMRAVGYRQAWEHLEGAYGLAELRERGVAATRQLAKRQLTWLRGFSGVTLLAPDAARARLERALGE